MFNDRNLTKTPIGSGVSGTVELWENKKNQTILAVKVYHCKEISESKKEYHQRVLKEYNILKQLNHKHIVKACKYKISLIGSKVSIFLEAGKIDIQQYLKKTQIDTKILLAWWKQLCITIKYLHITAKICHRDLKPANLILMKDGNIKLIDFATATSLEKRAMGLVGSAAYTAPETISSIYYEGDKCDIWSLGIILLYFITRKFPWDQATHSDARYMKYLKSVNASSDLGKVNVNKDKENIERNQLNDSLKLNNIQFPDEKEIEVNAIQPNGNPSIDFHESMTEQTQILNPIKVELHNLSRDNLKTLKSDDSVFGVKNPINDFLIQMLESNPQKRISITDFDHNDWYNSVTDSIDLSNQLLG